MPSHIHLPPQEYRNSHLARIINPTDEDAEAYQTFILAAVSSSKILQCPITQKIHAMLMHVQWQMKNILGGLGDKMEDCLGQAPASMGDATAQAILHCAPLVCAIAREKATSCNTHPDVLAQVDATDTGNKQKLSEKKTDVTSTIQKLQRDVGRFQAMEYFDNIKEERLTWEDVLFNNGKVDL